LASAGRPRGSIADIPAVCRLALAWYSDPRDPDWRPRSRDESQAAMTSAGFVGEFWELPRA
jgi:hypothetical protein